VIGVQIGLAVLFAVLLGADVWMGYRALPGSADAFFAKVGALLCTGFLIVTVPGLLWPEASSLRIAVAVTGIVPLVVAGILLSRRKRVSRNAGG
jgi:hypothetical protein